MTALIGHLNYHDNNEPISFIEERPVELHANLLFLYDYYIDLKNSKNEIPTWQSFELMDLWHIADCLLVFDKEYTDDNEHRYRYRYAGSTVCEYSKTQLTGRTLNDLFDQNTIKWVTSIHDDCINAKLPALVKTTFSHTTFHTVSVSLSSLLFPVANDKGELMQLVVGLVYE